MNVPNPTPPSQHRNKIAELQRDNRNLMRQVSMLLDVTEGLKNSISDAAFEITFAEHDHKEIMVLKADLEHSLDIANDKLVNL